MPCDVILGQSRSCDVGMGCEREWGLFQARWRWNLKIIKLEFRPENGSGSFILLTIIPMASLAQSAERGAYNAKVAGSIPARGKEHRFVSFFFSLLICLFFFAMSVNVTRFLPKPVGRVITGTWSRVDVGGKHGATIPGVSSHTTTAVQPQANPLPIKQGASFPVFADSKKTYGSAPAFYVIGGFVGVVLSCFSNFINATRVEQREWTTYHGSKGTQYLEVHRGEICCGTAVECGERTNATRTRCGGFEWIVARLWRASSRWIHGIGRIKRFVCAA